MNAKRFAIIGAAGYVAPRHMRAIKALGHELVAAYDPNDSVGVLDSIAPNVDFFREFECFEDYLHKLRDSGIPIDYVSVCSPNYLHEAHIAAGLRLNADVICEKPLVPTVAALSRLEKLEKVCGQSVFNILQLRHHDAIRKLKERIKSKASPSKCEVELTYITSRGPWYSQSWKGDPKKAFGIATNIGVHFFDMLNYVFGRQEVSEVYLSEELKAAGYSEYEGAKVRWFLSIDARDLPGNLSNSQQTFRNISIDDESLEFSTGFNDLHTISYEKILGGEGYGLADARHCISAVEKIRSSALVSPSDARAHPWLLRL